MARALQCPDCGHREPIDNVSDVEQFRCHGCGRALKVPPEFLPAGVGAQPAADHGQPQVGAPPEPAIGGIDGTELLDRVGASGGSGEAASADAVTSAVASPAPNRVLARAGDEILAPATHERVPSRAERAERAAAIYDRPLPLAARLAVWIVWLPLGLAATYGFAIKAEWINQDQLFDAVGEVTWGRFLPIARILPLAAIVIALLVHVTILGLETVAGRRRLRRAPIDGSAAPTSSS